MVHCAPFQGLQKEQGFVQDPKQLASTRRNEMTLMEKDGTEERT
jgi:hypothetical protein